MEERKKIKRGEIEVLFLDLDGTVIETASGKTFPVGIWDMRIKMDTLEAIRRLKPEVVSVISNQGGIEKGFVDREAFEIKAGYVSRSIQEYAGVSYSWYDYCETNDKDDRRRKPNPGMIDATLERLGREMGPSARPDKSRMLMVGDASGLPGQFSDSDKVCAERAGIAYMDIDEFIKAVEDETA